ncbi:MAG: NACHT domain-containing protein [Elainellaceae cyanobacterium]
MTGLEPAAIATTAVINAAAAGLTKIAVDVFRDTSGGFFERLRSGVDERTRQFIFTALQKYVENYGDRHCKLKVLGMPKPIDLEDVYTTVRLLDATEVRTLESIASLEDAYRKQRQRRFRSSSGKSKPGVEIARNEQFLMVLGSPGAGKSTFLHKMGLEALKGTKFLRKMELESLKGTKVRLRHHCIPVLLELKRLTEQSIDIKKLIAQEFQTCNFPRAEEFTNRALKQGKLLILFDGLDEVPTNNLNNAIRTIQDFVDQYSGNRYIASCRIAAYRANFRRFTDVAIADFDDQQIEQFIHNWFSSPQDQQAGKGTKCWKVLQRPENAAAKELAHTPLLLTFLCLVYGRSQRFPVNRAVLYGKALRILLEEWAAEKAILQEEIYEGLSTELEEALLSEIACRGFTNDQLFFSRRELVDAIKTFLSSNLNAPQHLDGEAVLEAIAIQQGIFVERAEDAYSFSHLTLQEYLTAQYIDDHHRIQQLVSDHLFDDRWREVFLLVSGLMRGGADELLLLMEEKAKTRIATPKLRQLLNWADVVTQGSEGKYKPTAKRTVAIYISRALNRDLTLALDNALDLNLDLELACALDGDLAYALAISRNLALKLTSDYDIDLDLTYSLARDLIRNLTRARQLEEVKLFNTGNLKVLIARLEALKRKVPNENQSFEIRVDFVNQIRGCWFEALQIDTEILELSDKENEAFNNYVYANELMVRCREAAVRVSPQVWEGIEERMVTVP